MNEKAIKELREKKKEMTFLDEEKQPSPNQ